MLKFISKYVKNERPESCSNSKEVLVGSNGSNEGLIARLRENPNISIKFTSSESFFKLPISRLELRSRRQGVFDLYWQNGKSLERVKAASITDQKISSHCVDVIPYSTQGGAASLSVVQKAHDKALSVTIFSRQINASGGKTSALFQLADVLVKSGYDVTICAMWMVPNGPLFNIPDGVKLDYIDSYMEHPKGFKKFDLPGGKISAEKSTLLKFRQYLSCLKSDFAYLPNYDGEIYSFFKENLAPSVCYILGDHNPVRYDRSLKSGRLPTESENAKNFMEAIKGCDAVHLVNPSLLEIYNKSTSAYIIPAPNSIAPKQKGSFLGKRTIISAGRMVPEKKHDELIEAFKIASERVPGWSLEIYGGGPELSKVEEAAAGSSNVHVKEPVNGLDARMRECAIHATASVIESFGLTIAEAMDIGIPVIAREHAGSKFLLNDDRGVICGPSVADLANSLAEMMRAIDDGDQGGRIKSMTEKATAFVTSLYPEEVQKQWRNHLNLAYDLKRSRLD